MSAPRDRAERPLRCSECGHTWKAEATLRLIGERGGCLLCGAPCRSLEYSAVPKSQGPLRRVTPEAADALARAVALALPHLPRSMHRVLLADALVAYGRATGFRADAGRSS